MLTDTKIRNAKADTTTLKLTDSLGLSVEIRPTGSKLWRYRYRLAGKANVFAIGSYFNDQREGHVSLDDARRERDKARATVKKGVHPSHNRQAERLATHRAATYTFEAVAAEWIAAKASRWSLNYRSQVESILTADVFPSIGRLPIRSVTSAHLLAIVKAVEGRGAATVAILIRQWASAIFRHAVATLRMDSDPASALRGAIHRPKAVHHRPLIRSEIASFVKALDVYNGNPVTVAALRLLLLTFLRPTELRQAQWVEIDLERAEWRIPAWRMKMREPHIVPLSGQAVATLKELHLLTGTGEPVFPHSFRPKACMGESTFNRALWRMGFNGKDGLGFSAHGFRATASTLLNESGFRSDVIERQLAHSPRDKVRASYNRAEWLEERRAMMQQWADMVNALASGGGDVVPLRRGLTA